MKEKLLLIKYEISQYFQYLKYKKDLPSNRRHDDIYIVEFPKSGITWLKHIIGNIEIQLANKLDIVTFYNNNVYIADIHQAKGAAINRFLNRTFIKSHAEFNPYYYFVVYLIRNPFDVMVSYYNYLLDLGYEFNSFEVFIKSDRGISLWKKHVNSWHYKKNKDQRMFFVKYEDLVNNPKQIISELYYNLIGFDLNENILDYSINKSSKYLMSESEEKYRKHNYNYTLSFVGKGKKIDKSELLSENIKKYIINSAYEEISFFYPELLTK